MYLWQTWKLTAEAVDTILYKKSGLRGISGISNDMHDLPANREPAAPAVNYFVYCAAREIGSGRGFEGSTGSYSPPAYLRACESGFGIGGSN
jgi:acetate kinase